MAKKEDDLVRDCEIDSFWLTKIYPDADASLGHYQLPLADIRDNCIVVLDANVLLLPYKLGAGSLDELRKVFGELAKTDRIFLPAQAVREFLKNRAGRVRDVLRDLGNQASQIQIFSDRKVGFLESDKDYVELLKTSEQIRELKKSSLEVIARIADRLKSGVGGDPVSVAYREIFGGRIKELPLDENAKQDLLEDMSWRYAHSIPPGYQDRNKDDGGIGDFLIWKTVLSLGQERKAHCIFVTEDSKGDWWVQSEGTFQPRIELVEEYRRATDGMTVHLLPLSSFLATFGAQAEAVDETQQVEIAQRERQRALQNRLVEYEQTAVAEFVEETDLTVTDLRSLMRRSSELNEQIMTISRDRSRLNRRLHDPELASTASDEEISWLFRERERLESAQRELFRERRDVEAAMKKLMNR